MDIVASLVKFNSQSTGRDKLCRTIQYTTKLIGYVLQQHGVATETIKLIKHLEVHLSTSRKLFRIGKYLDMLQGAARSLALKDTALKLMIISARLSRVMYFLVDQIVWAARIGIYKSDAKVWSKFQAKIWSLALVFCVARNIYDIYNLLVVADKKTEDPGLQNECLYQKLKSRPEVLVDTVKNCADFLIPLNVMGAIEMNNGYIGVLGIISSLAGALTLWQPAMKLKP